jgi:hypothetical protein
MPPELLRFLGDRYTVVGTILLIAFLTGNACGALAAVGVLLAAYLAGYIGAEYGRSKRP